MPQPRDEDLNFLIRQHQEAVRQIYEGKYDHLLGHRFLTQSEGEAHGDQQFEGALDGGGEARRKAEVARQAVQKAVERKVDAAEKESITARRDLEEPRRAAQRAQRRLGEARRSAQDAREPGIEGARRTAVAARHRLKPESTEGHRWTA